MSQRSPAWLRRRTLLVGGNEGPEQRRSLSPATASQAGQPTSQAVVSINNSSPPSSSATETSLDDLPDPPKGPEYSSAANLNPN